jgi:SAM-dependent methyltransferase
MHSPSSALSSARPDEPPPTVFDGRVEFASRFIGGEGLEIGALHAPLGVPAHARVTYVDRMTESGLREEYPELADADFATVDRIDDGELLTTFPDESQDFVIANHFLEHCENPIGTIAVHLRKLRPGGVLFYAVPDKRYTFDFQRPVTPLSHFVDDYENGPKASRQSHYEEWASFIGDDGQPVTGLSEAEVEARARRIQESGYSIHIHVWTQAEFLELLVETRRRLGDGFDMEAAARSSLEFIVVLRKA